MGLLNDSDCSEQNMSPGKSLNTLNPRSRLGVKRVCGVWLYTWIEVSLNMHLMNFRESIRLYQCLIKHTTDILVFFLSFLSKVSIVL